MMRARTIAISIRGRMYSNECEADQQPVDHSRRAERLSIPLTEQRRFAINRQQRCQGEDNLPSE